jgi:hypothetical protein
MIIKTMEADPWNQRSLLWAAGALKGQVNATSTHACMADAHMHMLALVARHGRNGQVRVASFTSGRVQVGVNTRECRQEPSVCLGEIPGIPVHIQMGKPGLVAAAS